MGLERQLGGGGGRSGRIHARAGGGQVYFL